MGEGHSTAHDRIVVQKKASFFNVRPEFPTQFTFNSDDPEVATVDNDFNIIGNKAGTALITVTMNRFIDP